MRHYLWPACLHCDTEIGGEFAALSGNRRSASGTNDMMGINRAVLIVKPKQPFLDWASSTGDPPYDPDDAFAFLVRELPDSRMSDQLVKKHYREIFEQALDSWMTDISVWPERRDLKTFREWFDVEYHDALVDLEDGPLEAEEF